MITKNAIIKNINDTLAKKAKEKEDFLSKAEAYFIHNIRVNGFTRDGKTTVLLKCFNEDQIKALIEKFKSNIFNTYKNIEYKAKIKDGKQEGWFIYLFK